MNKNIVISIIVSLSVVSLGIIAANKFMFEENKNPSTDTLVDDNLTEKENIKKEDIEKENKVEKQKDKIYLKSTDNSSLQTTYTINIENNKMNLHTSIACDIENCAPKKETKIIELTQDELDKIYDVVELINNEKKLVKSNDYIFYCDMCFDVAYGPGYYLTMALDYISKDKETFMGGYVYREEGNNYLTRILEEY